MKRKRSVAQDRGPLKIERREIEAAPAHTLVNAAGHLHRVVDTLEGLAVPLERFAWHYKRHSTYTEQQHGKFYQALQLQLREAALHVREVISVLERAGFVVFSLKEDLDTLRPSGRTTPPPRPRRPRLDPEAEDWFRRQRRDFDGQEGATP